ncbi:MAG: cyclodeaminase/cyclohydrolase family protein [Chloroflexi bacterium]|nr:cyclodeaminase/cyclohydrolase family protein [Chloroflexota bacterium]
MADADLTQLTVRQYLDRLASGDPTPGGGSAAALSGALGAALVSMVCNLTIGRERYASYDVNARAIREQAEGVRAQLTSAIQEDAEAYDRVMAAFGLPRGTDVEKRARTAAIQEATEHAALVPLGIAAACRSVVDYCERTVGQTNPNVASDLAVAALLARAGLESAAENVEINLASLKDENRRADLAAQLTAARDGVRERVAAIVARTHA